MPRGWPDYTGRLNIIWGEWKDWEDLTEHSFMKTGTAGTTLECAWLADTLDGEVKDAILDMYVLSPVAMRNIRLIGFYANLELKSGSDAYGCCARFMANDNIIGTVRTLSTTYVTLELRTRTPYDFFFLQGEDVSLKIQLRTEIEGKTHYIRNIRTWLQWREEGF